MTIKDWRRRHGMHDPVQGEFRPVGTYFPHPGRTPMQEMVTGVVSANGLAPTPAEVLNDLRHGKAIGRDVVPVIVDRADPTKVVVLWDEIPAHDDRATAWTAAENSIEQSD